MMRCTVYIYIYIYTLLLGQQEYVLLLEAAHNTTGAKFSIFLGSDTSQINGESSVFQRASNADIIFSHPYHVTLVVPPLVKRCFWELHFLAY